jgi:hypothetical protein
MDKLHIIAPTFTANQESAADEVRRQMHQAYCLINAARASIRDAGIDSGVAIADELLDMAEDLLVDSEYIDRLAPKAQEVTNG